MFSLEDKFGEGRGEDYVWVAPPPGSYFDHTNTRNTTRVQSTGSKTWDTVAYGKMEGTWNWSYLFDYNYLEPLFLAFEGHEPGPGTSSSENGGYYTYVFDKVNNGRVRPFVVRQVILNRMAGGLRSSMGGLDEILEIRGCVCTSLTISRAAGQSQFMVTLSGFYTDEEMTLGSFDKTDYRAYEGNLAEYSCLFIDGLTDDDYVANTESLTIKVENSAEAVYNICSPFAKEYYEGLSKYSFSTTAYANDPSHYQQRVYSGGVDNTADRPWSKGLAPIKDMYILSFNTEAADYSSRSEAYQASDMGMKVHIEDCVIKSLQWKSGNSEKLQDNISSAECRFISLEVRSPCDDFSFTANDANAVKDEDLAA